MCVGVRARTITLRFVDSLLCFLVSWCGRQAAQLPFYFFEREQKTSDVSLKRGDFSKNVGDFSKNVGVFFQNVEVFGRISDIFCSFLQGVATCGSVVAQEMER